MAMGKVEPKGMAKVHHSSHNVKNVYRKSMVIKSKQEESPVSRIDAFTKDTVLKPIKYRQINEGDISSYDVEIVKAVHSKNVERLRELFLSGRSMNACNQFGESLVHMVCRRGNVKTLRFMIEEANVSLSIKDDFGRNPFHDACWTSNPNMEIMELLVASADTALLLSEDVRGNKPFDYARREHHERWNAFLDEQKESILKGLNRQSPVES